VTGHVQALWSRPVTHPLDGLALARETGCTLTWDAGQALAWWTRAGDRRASWTAPGAVTVAACADDGSLVAAGSEVGQVWLLSADLALRVERPIKARVCALAVDHLGLQIAVADDAGGLRVLDPDGRTVWKTRSPRPLRFLVFIPEAPLLVGSADFGLVCAYDATGKQAWRDGLVAHVGSLSVSGDGGLIALACYTEGVCAYAADRPRADRLPRCAPCRLVAVSYRGSVLVTVGLEGPLAVRDREGVPRAEHPLPAAPVGLALAPLGDRAVVGLPDALVALAL
jgi:hypothetical protein